MRIYNKRNFAAGILSLALAVACGVVLAVTGFQTKWLIALVLLLAAGGFDLWWSLSRESRLPRVDERDQAVSRKSAWLAYRIVANGCWIVSLAALVVYGISRIPAALAVTITLDAVTIGAFAALQGAEVYYEKRMCGRRPSGKGERMDRSEDLKQVRDLHLVRDERDREVEAAAGLRAGNAVVLVSQLLSAVCLLQDDPAWMALLSLTLVWGGVKGFWRFRQDQERIYLVWGLLTCAGAAALLGLYFHRAWSAGMSFTRLLGYAVLCQVLTVAAGLLFVALLLGIFWLAHKLGHIEGERWEQYFQSVSTAGLLLRVGAVMAVALAAVAALSVPLFARLGFQEPGLLAALFFVARGAYLLNKFSRRRDELIQKLLKLKR